MNIELIDARHEIAAKISALKRARKVLDHEHDKLRALMEEWERDAKYQRTLMESVDVGEGAVAAGRMAVFERCAGELEAALVMSQKETS